MANQMPMNFDVPQENINSLYDFSDVRDGFGYETYYLYVQNLASGNLERVGKNLVYSAELGTARATAYWDGDGYSKEFYSPEFNAPRTMNGPVLLSYSFYVERGTSPSGGGYVEVALYHYDGTTKTLLGTYTPDVVSAPHQGVYYVKTCSGEIEVDNQIFKKGDQFIVKVTKYASCGAVVMQVGYAHDPQNRNWGCITPTTSDNITQFIVQIPFKVDV